MAVLWQSGHLLIDARLRSHGRPPESQAFTGLPPQHQLILSDFCGWLGLGRGPRGGFHGYDRCVSSKASMSAAGLQRALTVYHRLLGEHREHLNALNVYPVPDADTGTNLYSTLGGVIDSLRAGPTENGMSQVCQAIRRGAMLGARGASGVITSQLLGALVGSFEPREEIDGGVFTAGLDLAREAAYGAVAKPVEGTILTVLREAADAAGDACGDDSCALIDVLTAARGSAASTLARTPEMLPALKAAGVVDAGGSGLLLFFDALLHVVDGRSLPSAPRSVTPPAITPIPEDMPRYEVVVRLDASEEVIADFRAVWERLGNESTVFVQGDGEWVCHVHTSHPEAAMEAARAAGEVRFAEMTDLADQVMQLRAAHSDDVALIAVTMGAGLQEWFLSAGATGVVAGGISKNPSTAELLQAVETTGAQTVLILPNDENIVPAAEQVVELTERSVIVVRARSMPSGMAAVRRFDPTAEDGAAPKMMRAAESVAAGGVVRAVRDAASPAGRILEGTWLVKAADGTVLAAASLGEAVLSLLRHLVGSSAPSRIEIIAGEGSEADVTDLISQRATQTWPGAELVIVDGGQPHYPYLIGVESVVNSQ